MELNSTELTPCSLAFYPHFKSSLLSLSGNLQRTFTIASMLEYTGNDNALLPTQKNKGVRGHPSGDRETLPTHHLRSSELQPSSKTVLHPALGAMQK